MLAATIAAWGLPAVFVGAGLEGEATVICGGVLAQHRIFSLPTVIACASVGSFTIDQTLFLVGRYLGQKPRLRALLDRPFAHKALDLVQRRPVGFVLAFRFLYGLRLLSPFVIGTTHISYRRFLLLNAMAALVWAGIFATLGFMLGDAAQALTPAWPFDMRRTDIGLGAAIALALVALMYRRTRSSPRSEVRNGKVKSVELL
jgi:membrane protein DedA with SNARE-associated domain